MTSVSVRIKSKANYNILLNLVISSHSASLQDNPFQVFCAGCTLNFSPFPKFSTFFFFVPGPLHIYTSYLSFVYSTLYLCFMNLPSYLRYDYLFCEVFAGISWESLAFSCLYFLSLFFIPYIAFMAYYNNLCLSISFST